MDRVFFWHSGQMLGRSFSSGIDLGDVDGDDDLDAFIGNLFAQENKVWLNDGIGGFSDSGQSLIPNDSSHDIFLADLSGNGFLDAFVANGEPPSANAVYLLKQCCVAPCIFGLGKREVGFGGMVLSTEVVFQVTTILDCDYTIQYTPTLVKPLVLWSQLDQVCGCVRFGGSLARERSIRDVERSLLPGRGTAASHVTRVGQGLV